MQSILEYKFSSPPVNVMVYGTEYDTMRQPYRAGREGLHEAIATGGHDYTCASTSGWCWRLQIVVHVEHTRQ
jgi:hypothetical protein